MIKVVNIIIGVLFLCLSACASKPKSDENIVIIELTIPAYATVKVRNISSGEINAVKLKYLRGAYLITALKAGTYELLDYKPWGDITGKDSIKFIVADKCSNYIGKLNLLGDYFHSDGKPTEIYWDFGDKPLSNLHTWTVSKIKNTDVCVPHNGGVSKYTWRQFESKFLSYSE
jgi:hypothetical protein